MAYPPTQYMKSGKKPSLVGIGLSQLHKNRARLLCAQHATKNGSRDACGAVGLREDNWGCCSAWRSYAMLVVALYAYDTDGAHWTCTTAERRQCYHQRALWREAWPCSSPCFSSWRGWRRLFFDLLNHGPPNWILAITMIGFSLSCRSLLIWSPGR